MVPRNLCLWLLVCSVTIWLSGCKDSASGLSGQSADTAPVSKLGSPKAPAPETTERRQEKKEPDFASSISPLPEDVSRLMKKYSWRQGCPVPLESLRYLTLRYWDYDNRVKDGVLVVHDAVAEDVVAIFKVLFENRFPVAKMRLIDEYEGSDDRSMDDNNTSAFNCRWSTGRKGVFSRHSWGTAIDINPVANPYVTRRQVLPPAGKDYVDRSVRKKGMVVENDIVHKAFLERGWTWGGAWKRTKDYQHFEKKLRKNLKKKRAP